jgi:hypothetical protein
MWNLTGIEPERLDYSTMTIVAPGYPLRPEIIESTYYLYHYTHDQKYLAMGQTYFNSLVKYCRTDDGYATLTDVRSKQKADEMESFFFAETLKYLCAGVYAGLQWGDFQYRGASDEAELGAEVGSCTHLEYNCSRNENDAHIRWGSAVRPDQRQNTDPSLRRLKRVILRASNRPAD